MDIPVYSFILVNEDDFEEERLIEKLINNGRKRKLERKVSKYRDKKGFILLEQEEAVNWIIDLFKNDVDIFETIISNCINNKLKGEKSSRSKYIRNKDYFSNKIKSIIIKNRYTIRKLRKYSGLVYFVKEDIFEFLALLYISYNEGDFYKFVDIPDVSYVLRQLKKTGIEAYVKYL